LLIGALILVSPCQSDSRANQGDESEYRQKDLRPEHALLENQMEETYQHQDKPS
jgi:hypothetical protein